VVRRDVEAEVLRVDVVRRRVAGRCRARRADGGRQVGERDLRLDGVGATLVAAVRATVDGDGDLLAGRVRPVLDGVRERTGREALVVVGVPAPARSVRPVPGGAGRV